MKPRPTNTLKNGFTLIEVVVALAIFAAASVGLTLTFTSILTARQHGVQSDLLDADLRAVRLQLLLEPNLELAEEGNNMETLSCGEAEWQAEILPTELVDLFQVRFLVEFSDPPEGLPENYSETLYLLRPTWSEPDERDDLLAEKREALERERDFR
ncbi:MAG: prepilin-type N-terminal cleavage/methylation domain-containing protein [Coraliomargarita sp. TMED73]|nr:MAG: prepilin-type N-terminal cleavage/methylation domain-containing protein [Coraliomargarita sp. TMED73]